MTLCRSHEVQGTTRTNVLTDPRRRSVSGIVPDPPRTPTPHPLYRRPLPCTFRDRLNRRNGHTWARDHGRTGRLAHGRPHANLPQTEPLRTPVVRSPAPTGTTRGLRHTGHTHGPDTHVPDGRVTRRQIEQTYRRGHTTLPVRRRRNPRWSVKGPETTRSARLRSSRPGVSLLSESPSPGTTPPCSSPTDGRNKTSTPFRCDLGTSTVPIPWGPPRVPWRRAAP